MFISATRAHDTAPVTSDGTRFTPISEQLAPLPSLVLVPAVVVEEVSIVLAPPPSLVLVPAVVVEEVSIALAPPPSLVLVPAVVVVGAVEPMQVDRDDEGDEGDGEPPYFGPDYHLSFSPTTDRSSSNSPIGSGEEGIYPDAVPPVFPGGLSRLNNVIEAPPMASYFNQVPSLSTQRRIICNAIDRENDIIIQRISVELRWFKISDKKFCLAILCQQNDYYWVMSDELVERRYLRNSVSFFDGMKAYSPNGNRVIQSEFHFRYPQYFGKQYIHGRSTREHSIKMVQFLITTGHCTIDRNGLYFRA